jgi:hypothetical protein
VEIFVRVPMTAEAIAFLASLMAVLKPKERSSTPVQEKEMNAIIFVQAQQVRKEGLLRSGSKIW